MAGVQQNPGPGGALNMNDPLFKNWLKAAYSFKYLKSGLESFVSTQVGQRYSVLKQQVFQQPCQQCNLLNQPVCQHIQPCSDCTSNNLLPEHGANGCRRRDCFCTKRPRTRRKCPNNFCSVFYDLIVNDHAYNTPRWSSTDVSNWFHDSVQYAKCFLGTDSPASSISELDCTGILSIVVHNCHIHHSINNVNLFKKCRQDRNTIFHTGNYEVTNQEVNDYIDDMIQALEDGNSLINDLTANACVTSLNELKNDQIAITADIVGLIQESLAAINDLSDEVKQQIEDKRKQVLQDCDQHFVNAINEIKKRKNEAVGEISDAVRQFSDQRDQFDQQMDYAFRRIEDKTDEAVFKITQASSNDGIRCEDIKNRLVNIYKKDCGTLSVSPLYDEEEDGMELLSIYKPPSLYHVPYHRTQEKEGKYPILSYKELFCKDDRTFRKMYITGDAGVGKTSFCKRMSLLWCKSQSGECVGNRNVQDDINYMSQFRFVFHISLGDTQRKDVVTMIVDQLFCCENDRKKYAIYESIENIILRNKCVIILDALDEWTPEESRKININKLLVFSDKCTFIITCRPYKLENERLTDIDRHVQMMGINKKSTKHYVRELVNCVNNANGENKDPVDFISDVKKCQLHSQIRIPIIASHLVAVWFDRKLTAMSRALIYSTIVDMLIKRTEEKKKFFNELPGSEESTVQFPDSLSELFYLQKHASLMKKICFLSFTVLFKTDKCLSELVFTTEQLASEPYCVSVKEIDFLCKFGILSKNKVISRFGKREQKLSYLHKTYLEFFAALFVSSFDSGNTFHDVVKKWNRVGDVVQFETFFCFFVGFSCDKGTALFDGIYNSISDDLSLCRRNALFHTDHDKYKERIRSLQTMVINCFMEIRQSYNPSMSLKLQDFIFYPDDDMDHLDDDVSCSEDISCYNSADSVECVQGESSYIVLLKKLLLLSRTCVKSIFSVSGEHFDEFDEVQGLQCLFLVQTDDFQKFSRCLLQNEATLHTVRIFGNRALIQELPVKSLQHLTSIYLSYVKLQHDSLHDLVTFLSENPLIEIIRLYEISEDSDVHGESDLYDSDLCGVSYWYGDINDYQIDGGDDESDIDSDCTLTLNDHTKLTSLYLWNVNVLCNNVNISSLKSITLCPLSERSVRCYIDVFKCIKESQLQELGIKGCRSRNIKWDYNTLKTLTAVVKTLPCIKVLELFDIILPNDVLLQLHSDVTQVQITLHRVTMSRQCFLSFIESIVNTTSVIKVKLGGCNFAGTHKEASMNFMSRYLEQKPTIHIISKSDCMIHFETTVSV